MFYIMLKYSLIATSFVIFLLGLSGAARAETFSSLQEIPESTWNALAEKTFYFGHHSLGGNIINGIEELMAENPQITLRIEKLDEGTNFDKPVFAHSYVGENYHPESKIEDFQQTLQGGVGKKVDYAFMKFCFLDITRKTKDPEGLFEQYKSMVNRVQKNFPDLQLIHFTAPLTAKQAGLKGFAKKMLGKGANVDNITRQQFSNLLKAEYEGKAPIFDIAEAESTSPDGTRESLTSHDTTYYTLIWDYTDDSGHLNGVGRKIVAEKFLLFLANLVDENK